LQRFFQLRKLILQSRSRVMSSIRAAFFKTYQIKLAQLEQFHPLLLPSSPGLSLSLLFGCTQLCLVVTKSSFYVA
jgi:hypothetical protein